MAAAFIRSRLATVAALGANGAAIALLFVLFSAPDLAIAQILVESLTVLLFVLPPGAFLTLGLLIWLGNEIEARRAR